MALENPNIVCEQARKRMKNNELPDCVISYIFSMLDTKYMAKTMVLSKRWQHEWLHRKDMVFNFDMHDMFDHAQIASYDSFMEVVHKFTKIVGQCIKNYQGPKIRSIRVCFSLGDKPSYFIDSLISHGAAKGVERIELLLYQGDLTFYYVPSINGYELSKCGSLKYLHLQQCDLVLPMDFSGFNNLQTLVLEQITLKQNVLHGIFSKCIKVTILECYFAHDINIISTKLCHLVIIDSRKLLWSCPFKITVDAVNLLSFEYNSPARLYSIKAPKLLKFFWGASLHQLVNLVLSTSKPDVGTNLGPFQNVRQLEISIYGNYPHDMVYLKILDIVMASPNLQKLVLTISRPLKNRHSFANQREIKREHTIFFHNQLKYVELRCCFGLKKTIQLARHFIKNVNSLEQITFSPCDHRLYTGAEKRSDGFDCLGCSSECTDLVRQKLQDEVGAKCRLVIL